MLGLPLLSWVLAGYLPDTEPEVDDDVRQALVAVGSPVLSWLDDKDAKRALDLEDVS
jgi:hypothetical protein